MAPPSALRAATSPSLRDREDHYVPTGRLLPLPLSVRVERSRDTRRSCAKPDGHLDFARCERVGKFQGRYQPKPDVRDSSPSSARRGSRSEEHTSELQSLMRISYAAFCLK